MEKPRYRVFQFAIRNRAQDDTDCFFYYLNGIKVYYVYHNLVTGYKLFVPITPV